VKYVIIALSCFIGSYAYSSQTLPGINSVFIAPYFAASKEGGALVVWNTGGSLGGEVEYALFSQKQQKFTPATPVAGLTTSTQYVSAAMNGKKEALLAWNTVTGSIQYAIYASGVMSPVKNIEGALPYSTAPQVVFNDQGEGIAVWSDANSTIQYATYHKMSKMFSQAKKLPNVKMSREMHVACNDQGEALLLWYDSLAQSLSYAIYNAQACEFKLIKTIEGTKDAMNLSLALNDKGEAIVAWNTGSNTSPAGFLQYAVYQKDKNSFTSFKTMPATTDHLAQNLLPKVALNNKGEGVMVWSQLNARGNNSICYAFYDKKAKKFSAPKSIQTVEPYSTAPEVAINSQGDMMATWFSTQSGLIQYSLYNKSTKAFDPTYAMTSNRPTDQFPEVFLNDQGEGIIVWGSLGVIKYSIYDKETKKCSAVQTISVDK